MKEKSENNTIVDRSYKFSIEIIRLIGELKRSIQSKVIANQLVKSGTSIGANVQEAQSAVSKRDFLNKISIAQKEARETI